MREIVNRGRKSGEKLYNKPVLCSFAMGWSSGSGVVMVFTLLLGLIFCLELDMNELMLAWTSPQSCYHV